MAAVHRTADVRGSHPGLPCYELSEVVQASNVSGLGETAPYPVLSKLRCFRDEYEEKLRAAEARAEVTPVWLRDRASQGNALTQDSGGDARRGATGQGYRWPSSRQDAGTRCQGGEALPIPACAGCQRLLGCDRRNLRD